MEGEEKFLYKSSTKIFFFSSEITAKFYFIGKLKIKKYSENYMGLYQRICVSK
jgi:hypothetical protein